MKRDDRPPPPGPSLTLSPLQSLSFSFLPFKVWCNGKYDGKGLFSYPNLSLRLE